VAAVRSGKWKAAQDLINKIGTDESDPDEESFSTQIAGARRRHPPRLDWMPPAYPGPDIFLDYKRIDHLGNLLGGDSETLSPSRRRKVDSYLNQYPFMKVALKRLLWDERGCLLSRSMLIRINQPELDDEILRFAFSQVGTREARMQAVLELAQSGRFKETKVSLWDENQNQWHAVAISGQRIGDAPIRAQARTLDLIEKAHRAKTPQEAIVWLRKAVALEPTCGIALFNLGVTLTQNGNEVEGKALIYQSVDVDPEYTYGHASIALTEADNHQEKAALDHLEFVTHASVITHDTAVIANLAWCVLAAQRLDFDLARKHLDLAVQINPDHKLITYYETFLSDQKWLATEKDYLRESAEFTHRKLLRTHLTPTLDLQSCLESHTKDMLLGSAHFLRTASTGKKAELVYRLMCRLLNAEFLKTTLDEDLEQAEQEALRWLMAAGGVCPWAEFIEKFGDDMYESADWIYREPQSIPGHLRMSGLVFSGTLEGQQVAFIPPDLRRVLENVLK
jgi:tetratricopeptide (TPR) repeat protein